MGRYPGVTFVTTESRLVPEMVLNSEASATPAPQLIRTRCSHRDRLDRDRFAASRVTSEEADSRSIYRDDVVTAVNVVAICQ